MDTRELAHGLTGVGSLSFQIVFKILLEIARNVA